MAERQSRTASTLRSVVTQHYLGTEFNGFRIGEESRSWARAARALVRRGDLEVIAEVDYPNPSIRPWTGRRSTDEQLESLEDALAGRTWGACLYPTRKALRSHPSADQYVGEPYRQRLAQGAGNLELAFFRMDVLESYRNDPQFKFTFRDFGVDTVVSSEAYRNPATSEEDHISLDLGFAYRTPVKREGPIERFVCAFNIYLSRLTQTHQIRWHTYEVAADNLQPHAMWMNMQMGHWPDGLGPFEAFMCELSVWNELHERAFGVPLLHTTDRPREFGWIVRPTRREYEEFIEQLDTLLSDNLREKAFDQMGIPRLDDEGQPVGTISRLERVLERTGVSHEEAREVLAAMRKIRKGRSGSAHRRQQSVLEPALLQEQVELLEHVTRDVRDLRRLWRRHPANRDWKEPEHLANAKRYRL